MPEPRVFKLRQPEERRNNYMGTFPEIDKARAVGVYVRQSKTGADTTHGESRETQLGLQDYGKLLFGENAPDVRLYDEGAGISGQKRIDQRKKLDLLYQDMHKGIIGTIVIAREDRLFRNKHMDQVGAFTTLAEEKKIKVIVPPISAVAVEGKTRVYDFLVYRDLVAFQDKMREAYAYIEGHVNYMHWCQQNKANKGGYDGRALPPGLVVKGKKQDQEIVIYEPWAEKMRKLALRAQALDWDMGKLNREVAAMAFLFPEIPEEDQDRYMFRTTLRLIPGVGYKPIDPQTIKDWMTNEMLIGWFQPKEGESDIIIDHHHAVLDYLLFADGYANLKGYTLEGEPYDNGRRVTRIRKAREEAPDLLFHGRLMVTPPSPDRTAFISTLEHRSKFYYQALSRQANGMVTDKFLNIPGSAFDAIVVERLKALEAADKNMRDKIKKTLEQVHGQQSTDFISIHKQLEGLKTQLLENAKKRMKTSTDDPMYVLLQEEANDLLRSQKSLEAKKDKLGLVDSPEEIARLHHLLGNFEEVWPTFDLAQRQRAFSLLINRIEIELVSPHWIRLSIDWLDAISPRVDVAYLWKAMPSRHGKFGDEEKLLLKQYYPSASRLEILRHLPNRTWHSIQRQSELMHVKREVLSDDDLCPCTAYCDLVPRLDGKYLFRDYETTLRYIKIADKNSSRVDKPLYPIWIFPTKVEDLTGLVREDFGGGAQPLAVTMNEGVCLAVEADQQRIQRRLDTGYCDEIASTLDEALNQVREACSQGQPLSIGLLGNAAEILPELVRRGIVPDMVTDQTSAHDALNGYLPAGMSLHEANELRQRDPQTYIQRSKQSMVAHVQAMLELQKRGSIVFDYGNNLRGQALEAGETHALDFPGFVPAYIRPLFCRGKGPFRWVALSGDPEDIYRTDEAILELFPEDESLRRWLNMARQKIHFQGLPARICWLGYGERDKAGLKFNELVAKGIVKAPIVIGRDHLDGGSVASPYRETEAMKDGSDAIADWPLLNALLNTASGATWVSLHHGGGVGIGYSIHAGQVIVADGTPDAAERLSRVLTNDPGMGVIRHVDAGYDEAIACANELGVNIPMNG